MSEQPFRYLRAVVLDWAGTTVDFGSRAPAIVFQEIFRRRGVSITEAQAREPMGMAKRAHIQTIALMPDVSERWNERYGHPPSEEDVDAMYAEFLPLQKETLSEHSRLIPGAAEILSACRQRGLKIGSSTGYTHELMSVVLPAAKEQGYEPDCVLCSEDVPEGRPAPWMLFEAAKQLNVYPMSTIVKVDDTAVGIEAAENAGAWSVGISASGNGVGLSLDELNSLDAGERSARIADAEDRMLEAGADYVIESVADLMPILEEIDRRLEPETESTVST